MDPCLHFGLHVTRNTAWFVPCFIFSIDCLTSIKTDCTASTAGCWGNPKPNIQAVAVSYPLLLHRPRVSLSEDLHLGTQKRVHFLPSLCWCYPKQHKCHKFPSTFSLGISEIQNATRSRGHKHQVAENTPLVRKPSLQCQHCPRLMAASFPPHCPDSPASKVISVGHCSQ